MKIILSRKGFDSQYGKQASPILPDGSLISMPIPSDDEIEYKSVMWEGMSYCDIIHSLKPKSVISKLSHCHLDPDLRKESIHRQTGWLPSFGQTGSSLTELRDYGITSGDLFLFFGWFKETEIRNGRLQYKHKAKDLHVIYGYMQIGSIIESSKDIPFWLQYHPHANMMKYKDAWNRGQNAIYVSRERLSFAQMLAGSGAFRYDKRYVLTKDGYSRSRWEFPSSMKGIPISHNPNGWKENYFQSAARGQEFIMDATPAVTDWVYYLFNLTK